MLFFIQNIYSFILELGLAFYYYIKDSSQRSCIKVLIQAFWGPFYKIYVFCRNPTPEIPRETLKYHLEKFLHPPELEIRSKHRKRVRLFL